MSPNNTSTATKESSNTALVPKLRFPDFRDAEGWSQVQLIDTTDRSVKWSFIGGPFGSNLKSSDYVADGVRIIQLQNIGDGEFCAGYRIFTSVEKADELLSNNIYPGDIIMSKMGDPVGRACLIPDIHERYVMCSDGIRLVVNEDKNDKYFIYSLINSLPFRSVVEKTATGSTRKRIGLDELKSLPMWLPKKPEQQKIAECLSSVDELMVAQARKLDALKTHKKGLMQQLFPREGETQPRLRFPEFQNAPFWAKKNLRGLCERIMDGTHFSPKTKEGPRPYLTSKNIRMGWLDLSTVSYIAEDEHRSIYARCPVKKNDVLLTKDGANTGNCAINTIDDEFSLLSSVAVLRGDSKQLTQQFLYQSIASDGMQSTIVNSMSGQAITRITLEKLGNYEISVPSLSEQQRIASCLTSLDALIAAQTQKLDALKTHKKGLMQQLFPSPEAIDA